MSEPRPRPATSRRASTDAPGVAVDAGGGNGTAGLDAEDRRLATLHLRLGGLALARAELEDLQRRGALDAPGLADLAEARWRSGDLEAAATAALEHLAAGGSRLIARVVAAEAAAATGRPVEARVHVEALGTVETEALEHLFAGMPRRAFWPSAPSAPIGPAATMFEADRAAPAGRWPRPTTPDMAAESSAGTPTGTPAGTPGPAGGRPEMAGFWGDDEPSIGRSALAAAHHPASPTEELARARLELATGESDAGDRGLARLALVLRQDPALAADVLAIVGPLRETAAHLVRGDACRLLGRHLEAEAAFAAAARSLDEPSPRQRARPS